MCLRTRKQFDRVINRKCVQILMSGDFPFPPPSISLPYLPAEECVAVFRNLSGTIKEKKKRYDYSSKQVVGSWVVLTALVLVFAVVMNHPTLFSFLAGYHLGWVGSAFTGLAGAIAMVIAFVLFSAVQLKSAMETNILEINTLIRVHSSRQDGGEL